MTEMPKKIKVLHLTYTIEEVGDEFCFDKYGWCDSNKQAIYICESNMSERKRLVLFHEIGHAICSAMGLPDGVSEEVFVNRAGVGWITVLGDNPELVEYLFNCKVNPPGMAVTINQ